MSRIPEKRKWSSSLDEKEVKPDPRPSRNKDGERDYDSFNRNGTTTTDTLALMAMMTDGPLKKRKREEKKVAATEEQEPKKHKQGAGPAPIEPFVPRDILDRLEEETKRQAGLRSMLLETMYGSQAGAGPECPKLNRGCSVGSEVSTHSLVRGPIDDFQTEMYAFDGDDTVMEDDVCALIEGIGNAGGLGAEPGAAATGSGAGPSSSATSAEDPNDTDESESVLRFLSGIFSSTDSSMGDHEKKECK